MLKKLIIAILVLALVLPAAAMAEDQDPIIGCWYFLFDKRAYPEIGSLFDNADISLSIYSFSQNGIIMSADTTVVGEEGTQRYIVAGRWEKKDNKYQYSILGVGEGEMIIEDDQLFFSVQDLQGYYMILRRMVPFNPYKDYVKR